MRKRVLSSIAIALCFPTVAAAQELILLDFQIRLNGTLVGSPTLRVQEDSTGSLRLPDVLDIALAPTREDGGRIRLALKVATATGTARPVLVIDDDSPGVVKLPPTDGGEIEVELRVGVPGS